MQPTRLFNENYSWEKNRKAELALDLGTWQNRLLFSLSYYTSKSSNQLIAYSLPIQTGFSTINRNWDATIRNWGWEFSLDGKLVERPDFSWNMRFNLAIPSNRLLSFPGLESSSYAGRYVVGEPLSVKKLYTYLGIDREQGIYTFEDANQDGIWNKTDQNKLLNTDPRFYGGLSSNWRFKSWTMGILLDFRRQKGVSYVAALTSMPGYGVLNHPKEVLDRWQHPGDEAEFQRYVASSSDPAYAAGQRFLNSEGIYVDASYIKLRNFYLNYDWVPKNTTIFRHMNISIEAQNLLTLSRYKIGDPEIQNPFVTSPKRAIVLGLKLNF